MGLAVSIRKKLLMDNNIIGSIDDKNITTVKITPHNLDLLYQLNGRTQVFSYITRNIDTVLRRWLLIL